MKHKEVVIGREEYNFQENLSKESYCSLPFHFTNHLLASKRDKNEFLQLHPPLLQKYYLTVRTGIVLALSWLFWKNVSFTWCQQQNPWDQRRDRSPHLSSSVWSKSARGSSKKPYHRSIEV